MLGLYTPSTMGVEAGYKCVRQMQTSHVVSLGRRPAKGWQDAPKLDRPQGRTRRLNVFVLPMHRCKGVVKQAGRVGKKLGVSSSRTLLHFDDGVKELLS